MCQPRNSLHAQIPFATQSQGKVGRLNPRDLAWVVFRRIANTPTTAPAGSCLCNSVRPGLCSDLQPNPYFLLKAGREPRTERLNPFAGRRATDLLSFRRERPCHNQIVPLDRFPGSLAKAPGACGQLHDPGQVGSAARAFPGASKARPTNWAHQEPSTKKRSSPSDFTASINAF
jgi:hypothetical protein